MQINTKKFKKKIVDFTQRGLSISETTNNAKILRSQEHIFKDSIVFCTQQKKTKT